VLLKKVKFAITWLMTKAGKLLPSGKKNVVLAQFAVPRSHLIQYPLKKGGKEMAMVVKQENEDIDQLVRRFFHQLKEEKLLTKTKRDRQNRTRFAMWNRKKHKGEW